VDICVQAGCGGDSCRVGAEKESGDVRERKFGLRVLVAEDNLSNQVLVESYLKVLGCEAVVVADGSEAIEAVNGGDFDMILMDMQMPNVNGYEATRRLRRDGVTIAIIAVTANAMVGDDEKCLEAGCDDYMSKPLQKEDLAAVLDKYATLRQGSGMS
jgi:CheY-like chemotaxis protein